MSEFEDPEAHVIISIEYDPGTGKYPATLDIAWYDEEKGKNGYATLTGSAAKKLSNLRAGDIFHEKPRNQR